MNSNIILISGASRGIGRQIAMDLSQTGYTVIANYNKSEQSAKELQTKFNIDTFQADISKGTEIKQLTDYVLKKYGKIDVLINNAGISQTKLFTDITDEDWNQMINTNLYSAFKLTQKCLPNMIHNKSGSIINISSMNAYSPLTKIPAYSGAKSAISNFTQWLAVHFSKVGIRCNGIAPGFFSTKQNEKLLWNEDGTPTARTEKILAGTPMGRFGELEELIGSLLFLTCEEASGFVNGTVIPVDGAFAAYSGV